MIKWFRGLFKRKAKAEVSEAMPMGPNVPVPEETCEDIEQPIQNTPEQEKTCEESTLASVDTENSNNKV